MKIYTGTGDRGKTSLFSGERLSKADERIDAYGDVDELNSTMGALAAWLPDELGRAKSEVERIQSLLFSLGAVLATSADSPSMDVLTRVGREDEAFLEAAIDRMEAEMTPLAGFILPGGHRCAAWAHVARTVCRRAERKVVRLAAQESGQVPADGLEHELVFLNRVSDYLFVLARYCNHVLGVKEEPWRK